MTEEFIGGPKRHRGRPPGAANKITRDIRAALRDLAEGNADRLQSWLDAVAEKDRAEALRLWLGLLRYGTPTLQAAAIADLTPSETLSQQLTAMTEEQLLDCIVQSSEAAEAVKRGARTKDELLLNLVNSSPLKARTGPKAKRADNLSISDDEDLLR